MTKPYPIYLFAFLATLCLFWPENALAFQALQCDGGQPVAGTSLFDDSGDGACQFTGVRYIFSTIICQFVVMVNSIMGKLYCSIQGAVQPVVLIVLVVFVAIYGVQLLMGTIQLNATELIVRLIKMSLVYWLISDPTFGVSAGIAYMFNFFVSFISETTRWVVGVLDEGTGFQMLAGDYSYNPGITATFKFLDDWIFNALSGSLSDANAKVMGFFVAMFAVMPSLFYMVIYWWVSILKMLLSTLLSFLMAVVAISFLLGLSPIFISFMLFKPTFQFFDQWLRFMMSFSLQVMVSFTILTLWLFSLSLFGPFFNELSEIIFPYNKVIRPATAIYNPAETWGLCPLSVSANPLPSVRCQDPNFEPAGSTKCTNKSHPGKCYINPKKPETIIPPDDKTTMGMTKEGKDAAKVIPPSRVPEMSDFLTYLFYHLLSLIIVSFGFASLQKSSADIARQLAGPSWSPILNPRGHGNNSFGRIASGEARREANRFMSKELFTGFDKRHNTGDVSYQRMIHGADKMVTER